MSETNKFSFVKLKCHIGPLLGGILFALGLGVSGMTEPAKIIGFLDIFGNWDPSLAFVMVGAIAAHAITYPLITKRKSPLFENEFKMPTKTKVDNKLIIGSFIFGLGWGTTGLCPGPGIVSLVSGNLYPVIFVATMLLGMFGARIVQEKIWH